MKNKITLYLVVVLILTFCTACTNSVTYNVEGKVVNTKCTDKGKYYSTEIKLDNGVTYLKYGMLGCMIDDGVNVKITHDDRLIIIEIIVEGTVKDDNN